MVSWSDEFNGTTIDTAKWCHGFNCEPINSNIEYLDGQGHLVLHAKSGYGEPLIRSKGEPFGPYGIMDIRAKFADGTTSNKKCINNQMWMTDNGWHFEVDVATNPAYRPKKVHNTMMYEAPECPARDWAGGRHQCWDGGPPSAQEFDFNVVGQWHTYRFEWTPNYAKFYVENNGIFYENWRQTNQKYIPNVPMDLKIALCIGGCDFPWYCDGTNPPATPLLIDYVRFYESGTGVCNNPVVKMTII